MGAFLCLFLAQNETRDRERESEREGEREASEGVCADSTVHPSYVYVKTTNAKKGQY